MLPWKSTGPTGVDWGRLSSRIVANVRKGILAKGQPRGAKTSALWASPGSPRETLVLTRSCTQVLAPLALLEGDGARRAGAAGGVNDTVARETRRSPSRNAGGSLSSTKEPFGPLEQWGRGGKQFGGYLATRVVPLNPSSAPLPPLPPLGRRALFHTQETIILQVGRFLFFLLLLREKNIVPFVQYESCVLPPPPNRLRSPPKPSLLAVSLHTQILHNHGDELVRLTCRQSATQ